MQNITQTVHILTVEGRQLLSVLLSAGGQNVSLRKIGCQRGVLTKFLASTPTAATATATTQYYKTLHKSAVVYFHNIFEYTISDNHKCPLIVCVTDMAKLALIQALRLI